MRRFLTIVLVFMLVLGTIDVSAGILTRAKVRLLERGADTYQIIDEEYLSAEDTPYKYTKVEKMSDLALGYLYSGTSETTYSMLEEADEICDTINDGFYKSLGYAKIASTYAEFMNTLGVRELAKAAALKGIDVAENRVYNKQEKVRLYNTFIRILLKTRYYKEVNELLVASLEEFENVHDIYYKSVLAIDLAAYVSIMKDNQQLSNELFEIAYDNTKHMGDAYMRSMILVELADYALIKNNDEKALTYMDEANKYANRIGDQYYKQKAFNKIAVQLMIMGDREKAIDLLEEECVKAAKRTGSAYHQALSYIDIAGAYYVADNKERAYELLAEADKSIKRIGTRFLKVLALDEEFWVAYIFDDNEKAMKLNDLACINAMNAGGYQNETKALLIVAENYTTLRDFDKVEAVMGEINF